MFLIHRARFLGWFALRDLFADPRAFWATAVNIGTIGLLLALTAVAYGLAIGYEDLRIREREKDPLARTLWVESVHTGARVTPEQVDAFRAGFPEPLANPDPGRGVHPFQEFRWSFIQIDRAGRSQRRPGASGALPPPNEPPNGASESFRGRSLSPADPLLDSLKKTFLAGGPFVQPRQPGVIVTADFLRGLTGENALPSPLPTELWTYGPGLLKPRLVPVVGVVDYTLPHGHGFIVCDGFSDEVREDDRAAELLTTGPLPDRWWLLTNPNFPEEPFAAALGGAELADVLVRRGDLKKRLDALFRDRRFAREDPTLVVRDDAEIAVWQFRSTIDRRTRYEWKLFLADVRRELGAADAGSTAFADEMEGNPWTSRLEPEPPGHPYFGVVVRDIRKLGDASDAIEAAGYKVINKDAASQIKATLRTADLVLAVLTAIIVLVALIATWNLAVMQQMRANEKVSEIGMLKAMGMTRWLLGQVYLAEALVLWLGGVLAAALLTFLGRWLALRGLAEWGRRTGEGDDLSNAFLLPQRHVEYMLLGSLAVVVLTTVLATWPARRRAPMDSLNRD